MTSEQLGGSHGKTTIVTGASQGIGAAIAKRLAASGMKTVVNFRSDPEQADEVVRAIKAAGGSAVAVKADVSETRGKSPGCSTPPRRRSAPSLSW
jgi:NAD(P)-dependent dehydrogenase (short-subunit alcohol dehydrogenase family)